MVGPRKWLALSAVVSLLSAASAQAQTFVFHLSGNQEVPPVASTSSGGCMGTLNQPAATFTITCVHDVVGATVMHIHRGASGVNGPIAFDMGTPTSPVTATWSGMTAADISELLAGTLYMNIHTAGRPAGEIRGQILPRTVDTVAFTANGTQVVPPAAGPFAANCTANLDDGATALAISCTHNVPTPNAAHVHEAPAGITGPVVFTFPSPNSPLNANMPMTPRLVADFAATFLYLDIHGGGPDEETTVEIRGQIGTPPALPTTGTINIVKRTFPASGAGYGFTHDISGGGAFVLNDGLTQSFNSVPAGTYTVTESNPAVTPGNSTLADVVCNDNDSSGDEFTRAATIRLEPGEVVTCTFKNFRTAPADELFVFHLSGGQEAPPVPTTDRGGCMGRFDAGASTFSILCVHDVVDPTLMHIHHGAPNVNGPVVFDLGNPVSPVIATWTGMTPANVADLFAGKLYVNVHTAGRPEGEIRGQIVPRTIDTVSYPMNGSQAVPPTATTTTGSCTADLDANATSLAVSCTHNMAAPQQAHVHEGKEGVNGPLVFTFPSAASPFAGNVPMTPRLVAHFAGAFLYTEVHGPTGGEEGAPADIIRGQMGAIPSPITTGTIVIRKATSPAGGSGFQFTSNVPGGPAGFTLGDTQSQTFLNVAAGSYQIDELNPSGSGWTLTDISCDDVDSVENPFARRATVNLQGNETVTCTFTNLQTVAAPQRFIFHMSGDQEAPPVPTSARGGCYGEFDGVSRFSLLCTHNVVGPTVAHIHRGARGVNGPIVFDLGTPVSPIEAVWTGMTPADVADLLAGNLYVNVHASGRPAGEIRGQIVPRTVDRFTFPLSGAQEVPPTDSPATGACTADLADNASLFSLECTHNAVNPTGGHVHDAPPGEDGPAVFDLPLTPSFNVQVPLTPRLIADYAAGFLYVNIHSANYPEGEIRGQMIGPAAAIGAAAAVPTLSEWMLIVLALSLALACCWRLNS